MKSSIPICILLWFASLLYSLGSEVLLNGNFESSFPEPGMPNYWKSNTGDANLKSTANVSPFTNIYPTGKNAVMIADGPSNNIYPILVQPFLPSVAEFSFSFDFYLAAVSDAPWKIRIGDNVTANLDFFINSANSFEFAGATRGTVASLTGGTWYQLDARVNDTTQTFSASLVPFGGVPVSFSGSLYLDGPRETEYVAILDNSSNQSPTLTIDNFSVRGIPEPSTFGFLVSGFFVLLGCRQRLKIIRPILPFRVSL